MSRHNDYWSRINAQHSVCKPTDCGNQVDHSRYRINEFAFELQAEQLTTEIERALASGQMPPRTRRGDPGE